jgi:hypothetical protein
VIKHGVDAFREACPSLCLSRAEFLDVLDLTNRQNEKKAPLMYVSPI